MVVNLVILITSTLDDLLMLLEENCCWSLLGPEEITPFFFRFPFSPKCGNILGIGNTKVNDSMTFYNEYVLENSNAADYFNTHVVGFSFESRDGNSISDLESIDTTVWYSSKVGTIDRTPYEVYTL